MPVPVPVNFKMLVPVPVPVPVEMENLVLVPVPVPVYFEKLVPVPVTVPVNFQKIGAGAGADYRHLLGAILIEKMDEKGQPFTTI